MTHAEQYLVIWSFFPKVLGLIYLFVFFPFTRQMMGLFGSEGILPMGRFMNWMEKVFEKKPLRKLWRMPTLFWWVRGDRELTLFPWVGCFFAVLLLFGVWPLIVLPILMFLHLSLINSGQDFLSFGWELFLMEIAINCWVWFLSPTPLIWISLNLLLFRFHFEAGISKLISRDVNWRAMRGLCYHYESQPLPNTLAYFAHKAPLWFQKFSCAFMLFIEIVIPFLIFLPGPFRIIAFALLVGLQVVIWLTGNFSYLNHMTVLFCLILLPDTLFGVTAKSEPFFLATFVSWVLGSVLLGLQVMRLSTRIFPLGRFSKLFYWIAPFHFVNRYGIFAVMTTERIEIVVEGSNDQVEWKEYLFKHKPSELTRRPRRISPYQPRLDWQAWFLPFTSYADEPWIQSLVHCLLRGSEPVQKLFRSVPFKDSPPKYIRLKAYLYKYTSNRKRKETGCWWERVEVGNYSPTLSLEEK